MVSITRDFAPPFKLIAPFFIIGVIFYLISSFLLFFFDVEQLSSTASLHVISWVHIFLLGFVMMTIFGAMAQLIPVVLEHGHFSVDFYYIIWPLLTLGIMCMSYGFIYNHLILSFGGMIVLIAMSIFSIETFLTIKDVKEYSLVVVSMLISNIFLITGITIGFIMALTFAGFISTNVIMLLKAHVYMLIGGYVLITIMGFSYILIPMFGLAHGFSSKPLKLAIWLQSIGVVLVFVSSLIESYFLIKIGYFFTLISLLSYFYLIYTINKTRAKKENDMYIVSLLISFVFFAIGLVFGVQHVVTSNEMYAVLSGWLIFVGFFGFMILGHLYKIVPFLVWYERFSPLVGKQKVPMLGDMVPKKSANFQIYLTAIGIVLFSVAIFFQNSTLQIVGASSLSIGAIILFFNLIFMIRFK
ncbi:MAG: hypothetical protein JJV94_06880 [Sulfurospirillum sp.]|nr:hypothetical protein [Sulfurospirillum sp.]